MSREVIEVSEKTYENVVTFFEYVEALEAEVESLKKQLHQQRFNNEHNLSIDQQVSNEIHRLRAENLELREYKSMYEGLCK